MIETTVLLAALLFCAWAVRRYDQACARNELSRLAAVMQRKHAQPSSKRLYALRLAQEAA